MDRDEADGSVEDVLSSARAATLRKIRKLPPALYAPKFFVITGRSDVKIAFGDLCMDADANNRKVFDPRYDIVVAVPWESVKELHETLGAYLEARRSNLDNILGDDANGGEV